MFCVVHTRSDCWVLLLFIVCLSQRHTECVNCISISPSLDSFTKKAFLVFVKEKCTVDLNGGWVYSVKDCTNVALLHLHVCNDYSAKEIAHENQENSSSNMLQDLHSRRARLEAWQRLYHSSWMPHQCTRKWIKSIDFSIEISLMPLY